MKISEFDYILPKEFIAQHPAEPRSSSKLMILDKDKIEHKRFSDIVDYLEKDDVLVINITKVEPLKLIGKKSTGGKAEIFISKKIKGRTFESRIKTSNPKIGNIFLFKNNLIAEIIGKKEDVFILKFNKEISKKILKDVGEMPLPPYIKEKLSDKKQYQTIYAKKSGSIAAPTAGFHFTEELLNKIKNKGVKIANVCLHISFSTFLPVREENLENHKMDREYFEISKKDADIINNCKGRLFVVGTTSLKTLESACNENGKIISQKNYSNLFIYPGYKFKSKASALITNFHLPKSTLLLLVCAFAGKERIFNAYKIAIKNKYRFYSFGDGMMIFK